MKISTSQLANKYQIAEIRLLQLNRQNKLKIYFMSDAGIFRPSGVMEESEVDAYMAANPEQLEEWQRAYAQTQGAIQSNRNYK